MPIKSFFMKALNWKKILPHLIAILIFFVVAALYCRPALEGNVMSQHDIVGWKGVAQNAFDYKEKNGHFPLWNTNLFSGMPNFMIAMDGKSILPGLNPFFSLWLPQPANFFFYCLHLFLYPLSFVAAQTDRWCFRCPGFCLCHL